MLPVSVRSSSLDGGGLSPEMEMVLDAFLDNEDDPSPAPPSKAKHTQLHADYGFEPLRQRGPALVLIHGFLGWGETRPLWGMGPTYYPLRALRRRYTTGPVVAVDVGVASSSHDRACEAFAQLLGIRCDYGEEHARTHGHSRYGPDFTGAALLSVWDGMNPVHLIGHSFGGNTALALTSMICNDFWGVGSDCSWVVSCTCVASPLAGCTLPFAFGYQGGSSVHGGHSVLGSLPGSATCAAAATPSSFSSFSSSFSSASSTPGSRSKSEACGLSQPPFALRCFLTFIGTLEAVQRRWPRLQLFHTRHTQWEGEHTWWSWCKCTHPLITSEDSMINDATPAASARALKAHLSNLSSVYLVAVTSGSGQMPCALKPICVSDVPRRYNSEASLISNVPRRYNSVASLISDVPRRYNSVASLISLVST